MKIEIAELKACVSGAMRAEKETGKISFSRFTKKQRDYFVNHPNPGLLIRADSSAGVMLEFFTDAVALKLDYEAALASGNTCFGMDLYADGVLIAHQSRNGEEHFCDTLCAELNSGKKRITIYLPGLFRVWILGLHLEGAEVFEPVIREKKLLFLGDSITQGYVTPFPSLTYTSLLANRLNAQILNQAVGGYVFDADILDSDLPFDPDEIFVAFGTNDWTSKRNIPEETEKFYEQLTGIYPNTRIWGLLPIWRPDIAECEAGGCIPFEKCRDQIRMVCEKYPNVQVVETQNAVPHFQDFFADNVHPGTLGFLGMTDAIFNEMKRQGL